VIEDSQEER